MTVVSPPSTLLRWFRFNFVGGIGIGVQFAVLFVLKSLIGLPYLVATAIAVEFAIVHNFIWHERFTWADRCSMGQNARSRQSRFWNSWPRLVRFNLSNGAVSLVGNLALMKVMVGQGQMNYLLANAIAIALCSLANFLISHVWVFEEETN